MKNCKLQTIAILLLVLSSCVSIKPGSRSQRNAVRMAQHDIQYTHSMSAHQDWMRPYRNWWNRPQRMTRIPFTNLYIP